MKKRRTSPTFNPARGTFPFADAKPRRPASPAFEPEVAPTATAMPHAVLSGPPKQDFAKKAAENLKQSATKSAVTKKDPEMLNAARKTSDTTAMTDVAATPQPGPKPEASVTRLPVRGTQETRQAAVAAPALPDGIESVPDGVMELAMKIASGELKQLVITSDMVGRTMLYDGRLLMAGETTPVADAEVGADPAPVASGSATTTHDAINERLLKNLAALGSDFVTVRDLGDLLYEELGYKGPNSARTAISTRLNALVETGEVEKGKVGKLLAYRIAG